MLVEIILLLFPLISPVIPAPVRTELCCCGCTEEPCPLVGSSCPAPRAPCNSTSAVKCSALQRLFEISQRNLFADDNADDEVLGVENEAESKPIQLLPTLDAREVQKVNNDILEITSNKTRQADIRLSPRIAEPMDGLHRISHMMAEMEGMLQLMRDEVSSQITNTSPVRLLEEAATRTVVDASLNAQTPLTRAARVRRAETDNCNDEKLRKLIKDNIKKDAKTSKREIQTAANKQFGGHFNVICSPCEFSFVVASQKYCDGFKDDVACFAFLQPPTKLKLDDE